MTPSSLPSDLIEFRDLQGNRACARRDAIIAIMIISPLSPQPQAQSMIFVSGLGIAVSAKTAQEVYETLKKDLTFMH